MWSAHGPGPTPDELAQLLRWGRAQRISMCGEDVMFFDDEDMFTYTTRRTRPRYKSERRRGHREKDDQ